MWKINKFKYYKVKSGFLQQYKFESECLLLFYSRCEKGLSEMKFTREIGQLL